MTDIDKLIETLEASQGLSPEQVDEIIADQRHRLAMYEAGVKPKTKSIEDIDWEKITAGANLAVANMVGKVPAEARSWTGVSDVSAATGQAKATFKRRI